MKLSSAIRVQSRSHRFTVFEFLEAITRLGLTLNGDVARTLANVENYLNSDRENWTWEDEVKPDTEFYNRVRDILHDTKPLERPRRPMHPMFFLPRLEDVR